MALSDSIALYYAIFKFYTLAFIAGKFQAIFIPALI
jgi:hypothetical protein